MVSSRRFIPDPLAGNETLLRGELPPETIKANLEEVGRRTALFGGDVARVGLEPHRESWERLGYLNAVAAQ